MPVGGVTNTVSVVADNLVKAEAVASPATADFMSTQFSICSSINSLICPSFFEDST